MRVVFLDIDGVLNRTRGALQLHFDEDLLAMFKDFVEQADVKIVLSTFWRAFGDYIGYVMSRYGIPETRLYGRTPGKGHFAGSSLDDAVYASRSEEILEWLQEHQEVTGFVVLDDRPDAGRGALAPHFVHVSTEVGLTQADVTIAWQKLELPRPELASEPLVD
mmetsp:Transcript_65418/g.202671  ORF Transcript_65418/g.202671 Transcript_65418/m.202671 type:complete len:163 (+) Transcript_65418:141-629(+)|eukprot:CAMPEP_0204530468 /NCGR_PEP_ID=MMETSP0661-20131031/10639_1 /ASSEMBLY_ACC=CAM_ASM_000606 /TAXON_ID=109239 /ORGANISM="Alexandrium margalefi, Strain AMGDE01CS-322" /LENGTH=162 /DNA_ID=CAMNT_0051536563 /DNA_START=33 /DNA_END=521 /DNA_ORIENTATION=+